MSDMLRVRGEVRRLRLSEWARTQGIARITAYRMLKRGILPLPCERSPTGRWYVLVPPRESHRTVLYARAAPGPRQIDIINRQILRLSEWTTTRNTSVFTVVREIADPVTSALPRLQRLLADAEITEIIVADPMVVGFGRLQLLNAALAPQGRVVSVAPQGRQRHDGGHDSDLDTAITSLCKMAYGPVDGLEAARRALAYPREIHEIDGSTNGRSEPAREE